MENVVALKKCCLLMWEIWRGRSGALHNLAPVKEPKHNRTMPHTKRMKVRNSILFSRQRFLRSITHSCWFRTEVCANGLATSEMDCVCVCDGMACIASSRVWNGQDSAHVEQEMHGLRESLMQDSSSQNEIFGQQMSACCFSRARQFVFFASSVCEIIGHPCLS